MKFIRNFILLLLLAGLPAAAQETPTIRFGTTEEGALTSDQPEVEYTFAGEQGQFVTITLLQVDSFDPFLRLLDADGHMLVSDDDSAGSLNARIGPFELPANDTYTIVATSLSGSDEGAFTLSLESTVVQRVEYGQRVTGSLSPETPEVVYRFSGAAGDVISIDLASDDFDAYLTLTAPGTDMGSVTDDDSGTDRNARIAPYLVTEDTDFQVMVSSVFGDPDGSYTLSISEVNATPIAFNAAETVEISGGQTRYFAFEGAAGQVVDVRVDSDNELDTALTVVGPSRSELASADDTNGQIDPAVSGVMLTENGTHYIAVQPLVNRDARTPVIVKVVESPLLSLDDGPQTVMFEENPLQLLTFAGTAGETVFVRIRVDSDEPVSPNIEVMQHGESLSSLILYTISGEISFGVAIPADGPVVVAVTDYRYDNSVYTVSLQQQY
ncbi:MAG: hypothetical protein CL610_12025 [Anaerolineaceae bacterium]|nr:hypothetical protein [Anaerolineaceae bacterium]